MIPIEKQFFIICGEGTLLKDETSDDFARMDLYSKTLIPIATNHYSALANRLVTPDEWIDITIDPDSPDYPSRELDTGSDWKIVKSVIVLMASELYSKVGANGLDDMSEGGLSQSFTSNYSKGLNMIINSQKKLRGL